MIGATSAGWSSNSAEPPDSGDCIQFDQLRVCLDGRLALDVPLGDWDRHSSAYDFDIQQRFIDVEDQYATSSLDQRAYAPFFSI